MARPSGDRPDGRIRVLFLAKAATLGGMEQILATTIERLDPARFDITVLLRDGGPLLDRYRRSARTHVYERPAPHSRARIAPRLARRRSTRERESGRAWALDVATAFDPHVIVWHHNAAIHQFEPLASLPVPSLQQIAQHWSVISRMSDDWLRSLASRSYYLCEGETSVAMARFMLGVPANRIGVLRIGIDLAERDRQLAQPSRARRSDLGIPSDAIVVGTTGNLGLSKGPDLWLRAAAELCARRPGVPLRFLWVGGSTAQWSSFRGEVLHRIVRDLGLEDVVIFAGQQAEVYPYLDLCDIYVQPSRDDAFPGATLEAMALAKPVVTFPIGIGAEWYANDALIRVDSIDHLALAAGIERLVETPDLRERIGAAGAALVREHFDVDASVRRYEAVLESVASGGTRPQG